MRAGAWYCTYVIVYSSQATLHRRGTPHTHTHTRAVITKLFVVHAECSDQLTSGHLCRKSQWNWRSLNAQHIMYKTTPTPCTLRLRFWVLFTFGIQLRPFSHLRLLEQQPTSSGNKKAQLSLTNPRDAKACQNCSNSTCLQRCRWQYRSIFIGLAIVASKICEIPRNSLKIQTYQVQGHPRSSILVPIESAYANSYWS